MKATRVISIYALSCVCATLCCVAGTARAATYSLAAIWDPGRYGFPQAADVAIDPSGNVFVAHGYRITKLDPSGKFLTGWGFEGKEEGHFKKPKGVAIDPSGNVFVCDSQNSRIQKFDSSGKFLTKWGSYGYDAPGEFGFPQGVAVDSKGNVYVADTGNHQVKMFDNSGKSLKVWGSILKGDGYRHFDLPHDIAVDSQGNILVLDTDNHKVKKYDSTWHMKKQWGSKGFLDGQFDEPKGIAVDAEGNVYVADTGNNRIQKFDSSGKFVEKWGSRGSGDGQFRKPEGLAVDSEGNVYVADTENDRIQKFRPSVPLKKVQKGLTVDNVIMLKDLGIEESSILKKIEDTGTTFSADDLEQLKKAGFSEAFLAKVSVEEEKKEEEKEEPTENGLAGSWQLKAAGIKVDLVLGDDGKFTWHYEADDETEDLKGTWKKVDDSTIEVQDEGDPTKSLMPCKLTGPDTLQITVEGVILQFERK